MQGDKYYLWQMKNNIVGAWDFAHDECLELISKYWVENESKDDLTISAMRELDRWDQAKVDIICRIIQRTKVNNEEPERLWWAEDLVNLISEHEPELAPQVFVATVSHVKLTCTQLENSNSWHQLPAVAEAAPITFFEAVWPWIVTDCETWNMLPKSSVINHYGGSLRSLDPYTGGPGYPLMSSFLYSLDKTASELPERFFEIVKINWNSNSKPVHRIIARGLSQAASKLAKESLAYLCGDERRFLLGSYDQNEQNDTIQLIQAISPNLNQNEIDSLTNAIQEWDKYEPGENDSNDQDTWVREDRLRLLNAISSEYISDDDNIFIETEKKELPEWNRNKRMGRSGSIKQLPAMTKEDMLNSSDETILQTLNETPPFTRALGNWIEEGGYWEEPGGTEAFARELRDLAKENYERVLPLLPQLIENNHEDIAGNILYELDKSSLTNSEIYELIRNLDQLNPQSEDYRSEAGYLLYRRCDKDAGLPDDLCQILEKWLNLSWSNQHAFDDAPENEPDKEEGEPSSYLWSTRGGLFDSGKPFFSMLALTNGYLWRKKPDNDRWLNFIDELLEKEISTKTWIAYCEQLRWIRLKGCDLDFGRSVIQKLFDKHPAIPFTQEGIQLIALTSFDLTEEFVIDFLNRLKTQEKTEIFQAYGELLTLVAFRGKPHLWARKALEKELKSLNPQKGIIQSIIARITHTVFEFCKSVRWMLRLQEMNQNDTKESLLRIRVRESIATGMAFAAARLWDEYDAREDACNVLCQLIPHATPKVAQAIGTVFWSSEDFHTDQYTEKLLIAIQTNPGVIQGRITTDFVDFLASLLPNYRELILQITKDILAAHSDQIMDYASELHMAGPTLVNISMTLQRFEETRSEATTLLEQMLKMGLDEAYNFLIENDLRPGKVNRRSPRKRRRRKR
ncbi:MAG: hypothetical protein COA78_15000 [Blastopirellula sp.]|nr:MAG: hypothetical protein COA78_15000 [Blastopirellula sp.]